MKFRFIGDPTEPEKLRATSIVVFGYKFTDGEPVEVTDPFVIRKLSNHNEFEMVGDEAEPEVTAPKRGRPPKAKEPEGKQE